MRREGIENSDLELTQVSSQDFGMVENPCRHSVPSLEAQMKIIGSTLLIKSLEDTGQIILNYSALPTEHFL